jgi:hypothetical protein
MRIKQGLTLIAYPCHHCAIGQTTCPILVFPDVTLFCFQMPLQIVESQRLYRQIAEQLRALIQSGEFVAGERLPAERDLAQQLGVSRPTVREALIALEVEGVIEVHTGSGIYVCEKRKPARKKSYVNEDWGPLEVMSARLLIEAEIAGLAAIHATRQDMQNIAQALHQMKKEAASGQVPRHGDEAFHMAIAQACGNSVLIDTLTRYWQARNGPLFQRLGEHFENAVSWGQAITEHERIYQAIRERNSTAAKRAMQHHLKQAHKRYSASWRRAPAHPSGF